MKTSIILLSVLLVQMAALAEAKQDEEDAAYFALVEKLKVPALSSSSDAEPQYQFFLVPEIFTEQVYAVAITLSLKLDNLAKPRSGTIAVCFCKKDGTQTMGAKSIPAESVLKLLKLIGDQEVLLLPLKPSLRPWEATVALGGDRYTLVRSDAEGLRLVSRMAWECDPLAVVAKEFMAYALPYLEGEN